MLTSRDGPMLGRPKAEWSTMANVSTAGSKLIIAGDFQSGFYIADRLGMQVEVVPHMMGANRRPTGERGLGHLWLRQAKVDCPGACSSAGERPLHTREVTGSIPVTPTDLASARNGGRSDAVGGKGSDGDA
jgi:hypothetical protein